MKHKSTEKKLSALELKIPQSYFIHLFNLSGRISDLVNHDIKNNLAGLLGSASLAQHKLTDLKQKALVSDNSVDENEKLSTIIKMLERITRNARNLAHSNEILFP